MISFEEASKIVGLETELIERLMTLMGTPTGRERLLTPEDVEALRHCARVLGAGFPLVAFLQLVRVYGQSLRRVADAEVRLFHLYVHEPLIRDGVPELEMAEEMERAGGGHAADRDPGLRVPPQPLPAASSSSRTSSGTWNPSSARRASSGESW